MEYITETEFKAFASRVDAEDDRQNHRIGELEKTVKEMNELTISVEKMAASMEYMAKEQTKQGQRLEIQDQKLDRQNEKIDELKMLPAKKWDNLSWLIVSALVTGILGYILGMILR